MQSLLITLIEQQIQNSITMKLITGDIFFLQRHLQVREIEVSKGPDQLTF